MITRFPNKDDSNVHQHDNCISDDNDVQFDDYQLKFHYEQSIVETKKRKLFLN